MPSQEAWKNRHPFQTKEKFGREMEFKTTKEKKNFYQSSAYYASEEKEISSKHFTNIEHQQNKCKPNDLHDEIKINQHRTRLQRKEMLSRGDAFDKSSEDISDLQMKQQQQFSERYVF